MAFSLEHKAAMNLNREWHLEKAETGGDYLS